VQHGIPATSLCAIKRCRSWVVNDRGGRSTGTSAVLQIPDEFGGSRKSSEVGQVQKSRPLLRRARRTLFSELLDIARVREGNSDQPPAAVVQTFEQKYGLREKSPGVRFRVLNLPPAYGRKW
jgi:hypothetical protein